MQWIIKITTIPNKSTLLAQPKWSSSGSSKSSMRNIIRQMTNDKCLGPRNHGALTGKTKQVNLTFQPISGSSSTGGQDCWVGVGGWGFYHWGRGIGSVSLACSAHLFPVWWFWRPGTVLRGLCLDIGYTELLLGSELNFPAFTPIG